MFSVTFQTNGTFTIPSGYYLVAARLWAAGGGGGGGGEECGGGGGGGGGFTLISGNQAISGIVPLNGIIGTFTHTIGVGGNGGRSSQDGLPGTSTNISGPTSAVALGGSGGFAGPHSTIFFDSDAHNGGAGGSGTVYGQGGGDSESATSSTAGAGGGAYMAVSGDIAHAYLYYGNFSNDHPNCGVAGQPFFTVPLLSGSGGCSYGGGGGGAANYDPSAIGGSGYGGAVTYFYDHAAPCSSSFFEPVYQCADDGMSWVLVQPCPANSYACLPAPTGDSMGGPPPCFPGACSFPACCCSGVSQAVKDNVAASGGYLIQCASTNYGWSLIYAASGCDISQATNYSGICDADHACNTAFFLCPTTTTTTTSTTTTTTTTTTSSTTTSSTTTTTTTACPQCEPSLNENVWQCQADGLWHISPIQYCDPSLTPNAHAANPITCDGYECVCNFYVCPPTTFPPTTTTTSTPTTTTNTTAQLPTTTTTVPPGCPIIYQQPQSMYCGICNDPNQIVPNLPRFTTYFGSDPAHSVDSVRVSLRLNGIEQYHWDYVGGNGAPTSYNPAANQTDDWLCRYIDEDFDNGTNFYTLWITNLETNCTTVSSPFTYTVTDNYPTTTTTTTAAPTTTTSTTNSPTCTGNCVFRWNQATGTWIFSSRSCNTGCDCDASQLPNTGAFNGQNVTVGCIGASGTTTTTTISPNDHCNCHCSGGIVPVPTGSCCTVQNGHYVCYDGVTFAFCNQKYQSSFSFTPCNFRTCGEIQTTPVPTTSTSTSTSTSTTTTTGVPTTTTTTSSTTTTTAAPTLGTCCYHNGTDFTCVNQVSQAACTALHVPITTGAFAGVTPAWVGNPTNATGINCGAADCGGMPGTSYCSIGPCCYFNGAAWDCTTDVTQYGCYKLHHNDGLGNPYPCWRYCTDGDCETLKANNGLCPNCHTTTTTTTTTTACPAITICPTGTLRSVYNCQIDGGPYELELNCCPYSMSTFIDVDCTRCEKMYVNCTTTTTAAPTTTSSVPPWYPSCECDQTDPNTGDTLDNQAKYVCYGNQYYLCSYRHCGFGCFQCPPTPAGPCTNCSTLVLDCT